MTYLMYCDGCKRTHTLFVTNHNQRISLTCGCVFHQECRMIGTKP